MVHAVGAHALHRILRRFRAAGAIERGAAASLEQLHLRSDMFLRRLVRRGVIHEEPPGRYWLDEEAWSRYRVQQMRLVIMLVIPLLFALLAVALFSKH